MKYQVLVRPVFNLTIEAEDKKEAENKALQQLNNCEIEDSTFNFVKPIATTVKAFKSKSPQ